MSSPICKLFLVTILVAMNAQLGHCRTLPETTPTEIPKNSTPCSIEVEKMCSSLEEDPGNYSMEFNTGSFRRSGEMRGIKLHYYDM